MISPQLADASASPDIFSSTLEYGPDM